MPCLDIGLQKEIVSFRVLLIWFHELRNDIDKTMLKKILLVFNQLTKCEEVNRDFVINKGSTLYTKSILHTNDSTPSQQHVWGYQVAFQLYRTAFYSIAFFSLYVALLFSSTANLSYFKCSHHCCRPYRLHLIVHGYKVSLTCKPHLQEYVSLPLHIITLRLLILFFL